MAKSPAIPRVISGPGSQILAKLLRPLLTDAVQYDRVSCYYNPRSLLLLLREFAEIWKRKGIVRLIIGFHETLDITPALREDVQVEQLIIKAVAQALQGIGSELVKLLEDERQDILPILRELILQKALHVRLVTPRVNFEFLREHGRWPDSELGLFHSKFAIIHHATRGKSRSDERSDQYYRPAYVRLEEEERFSVVNGSLNESERGYGDNIEDAVLHRSWVEGENSVAEYFLNRFEAMWTDAAEDVVTMPFDDEFAKIIEVVAKRAEPKWFRWQHFREVIHRSPAYGGLALPNVGLLPHQLRCFREALSRWPIRVLLADEVGLGKTIEAGSIIHYLLNNGYVRKVAILTPASLRYQWQKELASLFDLRFWVYNPTTEECELDETTIRVGDKPLSGPDLVILSWHWARLRVTREGCRFDDEEMPDLLVVDEAHHARRHDVGRGAEKRTQLHLLLEQMEQKVPHVILLTATPFQTNQLDYYSLLELLGLPDWFTAQVLNQFARWTRGELVDNYSLSVQQAKHAHSAVCAYELEDVPLEGLLRLPFSADTTSYEEFLETHGPLSREDIFSVHPTTLLTIRNTRSVLRQQGYHFPNARLKGADIELTPEQAEWFGELEDYIRNRLGTAEMVSNDRRNIGRLRSLFRQRVVSSIKAARDSLDRRYQLLVSFLKTNEISHLRDTLGTEFDPAANDPEDAAPELSLVAESDQLRTARINAAKNERYSLKRLLLQIDSLFAREDVIADPKMARLLEIVSQHTKAGRKVLVFSRFTSTTSAIVNELGDFLDVVGVGRFDGEHVGTLRLTDSEVSLDACDRREVVRRLKTGRIKILVCSDAASEGLNLHAATVAINMDVPWNPSRVLQRFGRVDRLGQKADQVYLINMYYPKSIEQRMYSVLEDRRVDFRAVLGEVPEILSERQRRMVENFSGRFTQVNLTFEEIEEARKTYNKNQYQHLIVKDTGGRAKALYPEFLEIIKAGAQGAGRRVVELDDGTAELDGIRISSDPMSDYFRSWSSDIWQAFEVLPMTSHRESKVITLDDEEGKPLAMLIREGDQVLPLTAETWPRLFRFLFSGEPVSISDLPRFSVRELDEILEYMQEKDDWIWPDHTMMRCITKTGRSRPSYGRVQIGKVLGLVRVAGLDVPQADDVRKVAMIPILIAEGYDDKWKVAAYFKFHPRQSDYYAEAAQFLGLVTRSEGKYRLTDVGSKFVGLSDEDRSTEIVQLLLNLPLVIRILDELRSRSSHSMPRADIAKLIDDNSHIGGTTVHRRTMTILSWLRHLGANTDVLRVDDDIVVLGS